MNTLFCAFAAVCCTIPFAQPSAPSPTAQVVTSAGKAPSPAGPQENILVEINIYQFKAPAAGNAQSPAADAPVREGAPSAPEVADPGPGGAPLNLVAPEEAVRVFGKTMRLDSPELNAFRISAPRILCRPGQPASIMIGRELEYLEPAGDKLFRAVMGPDLFEGLKVEVTASGQQGPIKVERLSVRLSECVERRPVEGLDLPVGKPVMHTREVSTQFTIEPGQRGLIPIRADGSEEKPEHLLVVVRLERAASQPAAAPAK